MCKQKFTCTYLHEEGGQNNKGHIKNNSSSLSDENTGSCRLNTYIHNLLDQMLRKEIVGSSITISAFLWTYYLALVE